MYLCTVYIVHKYIVLVRGTARGTHAHVRTYEGTQYCVVPLQCVRCAHAHATLSSHTLHPTHARTRTHTRTRAHSTRAQHTCTAHVHSTRAHTAECRPHADKSVHMHHAQEGNGEAPLRLTLVHYHAVCGGHTDHLFTALAHAHTEDTRDACTSVRVSQCACLSGRAWID